MTIFITLYEIMGITGGEIYLRFKAGATVDVMGNCGMTSYLCCFLFIFFTRNPPNQITQLATE